MCDAQICTHSHFWFKVAPSVFPYFPQNSVFFLPFARAGGHHRWVPILILNAAGSETITNVSIPWGFICASSSLALLFNFSVNFGVAYTFVH